MQNMMNAFGCSVDDRLHTNLTASIVCNMGAHRFLGIQDSIERLAIGMHVYQFHVSNFYVETLFLIL
jgi:hypothetical protein